MIARKLKFRHALNPKINLPDDNQIASGKHLTIFSKNKELIVNTKKGSYSNFYDSIDGDGFVSEVILYDKESKRLFYERKRYYAFQ